MKNNIENNRKSICFLTHGIVTGGIEKVLIEALNCLHDKYDIQVVSLFGGVEQSFLDSCPRDVKVVNGQAIKNKFFNKLKNTRFFSRFYFKKVINREFDYVISLKFFERLACLSNIGKYHIHWCHNDSHTAYFSEKLSKPLKKEKRITTFLYKRHTMVWTVNQIIADELKSIFSLNNIYALTNPINCNDIINKSLEPCDIVFDKSKTNIVLLGRLSNEKGFGKIIDIMSQGIFEKYTNAHIYIIGDGALKRRFESTLEKYGFKEKVTFLGKKANPYPYLKQAQLLISPSQYESFGLSILEAMLLNIPVIATKTTGGKYTTQNGKYAWCVKSDNESLANAIEKFLNNPDSYEFSREEVENWVWQHDVEVFKNRIFELLEKCEEAN